MEGGAANNSDDENNSKKLPGNFKIKLKIPKPAQIADDDELEEGEIREDQEQVAEVTPAADHDNNGVTKSEITSPNQDQGVVIQSGGGLRVCPVCQKGFSSGKALGGHMRIHAEPTPNNGRPHHLNKKLKIAPGRFSPNLSSSPRREQQVMFQCCHCPKEFPSEKSLFGHMRSHPERLWRGMNPPPDLMGSGPGPSSLTTPRPDPDPDADKTTTADHTEIGIRWEVQGKRGQNQHRDQLAEVAAMDLLLIQAGEGERSRVTKEKGKGKIKEYDSDEIYYLKNMGYLDSDDYDTEEEEEVVMEKKPVLGVKIENEGDDNDEIKGGKRLGEKSRRKGKRARVSCASGRDDLQGEAGASSSGTNNNNNNNNSGSSSKNDDNKWSCNTCNRTFPTHQALGGHRSSHKKEKTTNNIHTTPTHVHIHLHIDTRVVDTSDETDDQESQPYAPPCEPSSSSLGQSSCQTGRRDNAMEFDLNETPSTMLEEEEEAEGDIQSDLKFF